MKVIEDLNVTSDTHHDPREIHVLKSVFNGGFKPDSDISKDIIPPIVSTTENTETIKTTENESVSKKLTEQYEDAKNETETVTNVFGDDKPTEEENDDTSATRVIKINMKSILVLSLIFLIMFATTDWVVKYFNNTNKYLVNLLQSFFVILILLIYSKLL